ncbi:hypothetical protein [Caminibacter sp.]
MRKILEKKLENYFKEANSHIQMLNVTKEKLSHYFTIDKLLIQNIEIKLLIDSMIFRFSKLQDLLGAKIFKNILEYEGINTNTKFYNLLEELEK